MITTVRNLVAFCNYKLPPPITYGVKNGGTVVRLRIAELNKVLGLDPQTELDLELSDRAVVNAYAQAHNDEPWLDENGDAIDLTGPEREFKYIEDLIEWVNLARLRGVEPMRMFPSAFGGVCFSSPWLKPVLYQDPPTIDVARFYPALHVLTRQTKQIAGYPPMPLPESIMGGRLLEAATELGIVTPIYDYELVVGPLNDLKKAKLNSRYVSVLAGVNPDISPAFYSMWVRELAKPQRGMSTLAAAFTGYVPPVRADSPMAGGGAEASAEQQERSHQITEEAHRLVLASRGGRPAGAGALADHNKVIEKDVLTSTLATKSAMMATQNVAMAALVNARIDAYSMGQMLGPGPMPESVGQLNASFQLIGPTAENTSVTQLGPRAGALHASHAVMAMLMAGMGSQNSQYTSSLGFLMQLCTSTIATLSTNQGIQQLAKSFDARLVRTFGSVTLAVRAAILLVAQQNAVRLFMQPRGGADAVEVELDNLRMQLSPAAPLKFAALMAGASPGPTDPGTITQKVDQDVFKMRLWIADKWSDVCTVDVETVKMRHDLAWLAQDKVVTIHS
jgi:hypothetical protein